MNDYMEEDIRAACEGLKDVIGITIDELLNASKPHQEDCMRSLCMLYLASEGKEKDEIGSWIFIYCKKRYYKLIKTYGADRDDVFSRLMCKMYNNGIESYVAKCRTTTFESHLLVNAKDVAYKEANWAVGSTIAHYHKKLRDISENYGIPICVSNAYKFEKILNALNNQDGKKEDISINKIISVIEGYVTIKSFNELKKDEFE